MSQSVTDQSFVEYVVKSIVDHPTDVKTERTVDERGVLIQLTVNPDDMGKVIGKDGRTAVAIRKLLHVLGAKNDARVNLKIVEPGGEDAEVSKKKGEDADLADHYTKATEEIVEI